MRKSISTLVFLLGVLGLLSCTETHMPEDDGEVTPNDGPIVSLEKGKPEVLEDTTAQTDTPTSEDSAAKQTFSGPAKIVFDSKFHNFGTHKVGDSVVTYYAFQNHGSDVLELKSAKPSCSCTGVQLPTQKRFEAGEGGKIRVSYPTQGKLGFNAKNVLIFTNASNKPEKLEFQLEVEQ